MPESVEERRREQEYERKTTPREAKNLGKARGLDNKGLLVSKDLN